MDDRSYVTDIGRKPFTALDSTGAKVGHDERVYWAAVRAKGVALAAENAAVAPAPAPVPPAADAAALAAARMRGLNFATDRAADALKNLREAEEAAAAEKDAVVREAHNKAGSAWKALADNTIPENDAGLYAAAMAAREEAAVAKARAEASALARLRDGVTADSSERLAKEKKAITAAGTPQPGWDRFPLVTETRKSVLGIARESGRSWTRYERDTANGVINLNTDWLRNNRNLEPEKKIAVEKEINDHRATVTQQEELGLKGGRRRHKTPKRRRVRKSTFRRHRKH